MAKKKITFSPDPKVDLKAETVNRYEVAKDRTPSDGVLDYDYPEGIAIEWVKKNPDATHLIYTDVNGKKQSTPLKSKTEAGKVAEVLEWMRITNGLTDIQGNNCAVPYMHIQPGWNLIMPEGNAVVTPKQSRIKASECKTCDMLPPAPPKQDDIELPPMPEMPKGGGGLPPRLAAQPIGVRAPFYAASGNLGANGRKSEQQDVQNFLLQLGLKPNQPHTAARGSNPRSNGIHSMGDAIAATLRVVPWLPIPFTSGSLEGAVALIGLDTNILPGTSPRREGSDASQQDGPEKFGPPNLFFIPSEKTIIDATLLPGVGVYHDKDGRLLDIVGDKNTPGAVFNNNQFFTIPGNGAYTPSITMNEEWERTGEHPTVLPLQRTPSAPLAVPLNNYAVAHYVDTHYAQPKILAAYKEVAEAPTQENVQRLVSLYNLRQNLTGISNYPVNAKIDQQLSPEDVLRLNPAERIAHARWRVLDAVKDKPGIDISKLNMNEIADVRTQTKAEKRADMVAYYDAMAKGDKEDKFRNIYNRLMREDAQYDKNDDAARRAVVERFVDTLPYIQTYPEQGFTREDMKKFYLSPRKDFNPIENRTLRPSTVLAPDTTMQQKLQTGMEAIAGDDDSVRLVLERSANNPHIAQVFGLSDLYSIQAKTDHRGQTFGPSKEDAVAAIGKLGYPKELAEAQFTAAYSSDRLMDMAAIQAALGESAKDGDIRKLRADHLRHMATDGRDGSEVGKGAHAKAFFHALASEKDCRTLIGLMDLNEQKYSPEVANQKNEALLHATVSSLDDVTQQHLGVSHSKLAELVKRRSDHSKQVGKPDPTKEQVDAASETLAKAGVTAAAPKVTVSPKEEGKAEVQTVTPVPVTPVTPEVQRALDTLRTADGRDVDLVADSLGDNQLNARVLKDLAAKDPAFMLAAILKAHTDRPDMQESTVQYMRAVGWQKRDGFFNGLFGRTQYHALANDLEALFAAQKSGDTKAVTELTQKLATALKDNPTAMGELFTTMTASRNGEPSPNATALTATLFDVLHSTKNKPSENPLAGSSLNARDAQALIFGVVANVDPTNAAQLSAQAQNIIKNSYKTHSLLLPVLIYAHHKPHPGNPGTPTTTGIPDNCSATPCLPPPPPPPPSVRGPS